TTEANYGTALKIIKDRFGKTDLIVDKLIVKLSKLHCVKSSHDSLALRKLYDHVNICIRQLENLGKPVSEISSAFYPIVLSCMPSELQLLYHRQNRYETPPNVSRNGSVGYTTPTASTTDVTETTKLEALLDFMRHEIESRELCSQFSGTALSASHSHSEHNFKKSANRSSRSFRRESYSTLGVTTKPKCLFCNSTDHASKNCTANMTYEQRIERIRGAKVCFRCLSGSHRRSDCKSTYVQCN